MDVQGTSKKPERSGKPRCQHHDELTRNRDSNAHDPRAWASSLSREGPPALSSKAEPPTRYPHRAPAHSQANCGEPKSAVLVKVPHASEVLFRTKYRSRGMVFGRHLESERHRNGRPQPRTPLRVREHPQSQHQRQAQKGGRATRGTTLALLSRETSAGYAPARTPWSSLAISGTGRPIRAVGRGNPTFGTVSAAMVATF